MQSESIAELAAALAKAQAKFTNPPRSHEGHVTGVTKAGKPYDFKYFYADLAATIGAVREHLNAEGLAVVQLIEPDGNGGLLLGTQLIHSSGQWIRGDVTIPANLSSQDLGSALTYRRRYALSAMLGIAAEDDDDGASATEREKGKPADDAGMRARLNVVKPETNGNSTTNAPVPTTNTAAKFTAAVCVLTERGDEALKAVGNFPDPIAEMQRRVAKVLGGHGFERLMEVTDRDAQLAIYREIDAIVRDLEANAKAVAEAGI